MNDKQRAAVLAQARKHLERTTQGYNTTGSEWRAALAFLDKLEADLDPKAKVPALGPVVTGGTSILLEDLTHATGGIPHYPAFDTGFKAGARVIAPEALTVTNHGHAVRRDGTRNGRIVYATGASGLNYVFVHVEDPAAIGAKVRKGAKLAVVSANHEVPHLHVGIDAKPLIGKELEHHTDYTHGGKKLGVQLAQAP